MNYNIFRFWVFIVVFIGLFSACAKQKTLHTSILFPVKNVQTELESIDNKEYVKVFNDAVRARNVGDLQSAANYFEKCIEIDSMQPLAFYHLSQLAMAGNDYNSALLLARDAYMLSAGDEAYGLHFGSLYSATGAPDSAIVLYERLLKKHPKSPALLFALSGGYMDTDKKEEAGKVIQKLLKVAPDNEQTLFRHYQYLLWTEDYDNALIFLKSKLKKYPENYKIHSALGEYYVNFKDDDNAFKHYRAMSVLNPDLPVSYIGMVKFYAGQDSLTKLSALTKSFITNDSIELIDKMQFLFGLVNDTVIVTKNPDFVINALNAIKPPAQNQPGIAILYSEFYKNTGDYEKADFYLAGLKEIRKNDCNFWVQRIMLLSRTKNFAKLRDVATESLTWCKENPLIFLFKGMAEIETEMYEKSIESLKTGLSYIGTNKKMQATFYAMLGSAYNGLKNYSLSDDFFQLSISLEPEDYGTLNNYSYFLSLRGTDLLNAEKMILKAIEADPENTTFLDTYAWVLYKTGQYSEALKVMEKVIADPIKNVEVYAHYVMILYSSGNKDKAKEEYEKMKNEYSSYPEIDKCIKEVEDLFGNGK